MIDDTVDGDVAVFLIRFDKSGVAVGIKGGNTGSAGATSKVKDIIIWVGVSIDEVFDKCYWFLGGVNRWMRSVEVKDRGGVFLIRDNGRGFIEGVVVMVDLLGVV